MTPEGISEQNVEALVRGNHDAFTRHDLNAFVVAWDEECEYQPALERDIAGDENRYRGHEGFAAGGKRCWTPGATGRARYTRFVHPAMRCLFL